MQIESFYFYEKLKIRYFTIFKITQINFRDKFYLIKKVQDWALNTDIFNQKSEIKNMLKDDILCGRMKQKQSLSNYIELNRTINPKAKNLDLKT